MKTRFPISTAAAVALVVLGVFLGSASSASAQFFSVCERGTDTELLKNVAAHDEHAARLMGKFKRGRYDNRPLPRGFVRAGLERVRASLRRADRRSSAILFYAHSERSRRLCIWLLTDREIFRGKATISSSKLSALASRIRSALGVAGASARSPRLRGVALPAARGSHEDTAGQALADAAQVLFAGEVGEALRHPDSLIRTLVVLPLMGIETIPFAALPLGDGVVSDRLSILVAPSFHAIVAKPPRTTDVWLAGPPLVVGDPTGFRDKKWEFPPLPGARAEALAVAKLLAVEPLIGPQATEIALERALKREPAPGLIYLATHAIADRRNPRNGSFLLTADGRWTAAEIGRLKLHASLPTVVMSACQTGLGKGFEVGTIGLAQAWRNAGASTVVMSLWSVEDDATRTLMLAFVEGLKAHPPHVALRRAMLATRKVRPNPAHWAGFTIYGVP